MIESVSRTGPSFSDPRGAASPTSGQTTLGQQDFLTLLTTQMQNQDPLSPMENGEFLAQMAQFSTVAGIDRVNDTLTTLTAGMRDSRMATAANLLGHQVLVPSNITRPDQEGAITGVLDLPENASAVVVTYSDPANGDILHREDLGSQPAGLVGFSWQNLPESLTANRSPVRVSATVVTASGSMEIGSSVYARVLSARASGYASDDITLDIEDFGALNALEIEAFR